MCAIVGACIRCGNKTNLFLSGQFICPHCYCNSVAGFLGETNKASQPQQMTLHFALQDSK